MLEHPALIFDLGSYNIKVGFGYDDFPRLIPSAFPAGHHDFPIDKSLPLDCLPCMAISKGEITNEDRMNYIFTAAYDSIFTDDQPEPDDLHVILNFPPFPSRRHMAFIGQAMFELLNADSIIMYPSTYMSQAQYAHVNSICVDVGYGITQVGAIEDKRYYPHSSLKSCSAGSSLDLFTSVDQFNIKEYKTWEQMEQARIKKEKESVCSLDFEEDISKDKDMFPYVCGELLFNPKLYEAVSFENEEVDDNVSMLMDQLSLPEIIKNSIELCHENKRRILWKNIIVTGGTSQMKGFRERLLKDLNEIAPAGAKPRLTFVEDPITDVWKGGKNLMLPHENWLNILDYKEDPDFIFNRFVKY